MLRNLKKDSQPRFIAVMLMLILFTAGSFPTAGHLFPGLLHWLAHIVTYALIAFFFGLGWPLRSTVQIVAFVSTIGAIHEATEIITHNHGFEWEDVMVNAIGALTGAIIQRTLFRKTAP